MKNFKKGEKESDIARHGYRVLAHNEKDELYLAIHTVYYDNNNNPIAYSEKPSEIGSDSLEGLYQQAKFISELTSWLITAHGRKNEAFKVLWAGEMFPHPLTNEDHIAILRASK